MARIWKEKLDSKKHIDYMRCPEPGGYSPRMPDDNLIEKWAYFVEVCSFTFQFHSIEQIEQCLDYFAQKIHPSSRRVSNPNERYWQRWYERLPQWLFEEPKRQKIVKTLENALVTFEGK
jgi:hypothetical protein